MTDARDTDAIMNQPRRVRAMRRAAETVADGIAPLVNLYRPYVDGLANIPGTVDSCWWATTPSSAPRRC